ncbi:hypothetical protein [Rufibacter latericius]|uniref:Lipoprotein n=1 Tax=Rufibacter latericius TaxID=2487040 RepID=A0A3M9MDG7_9BACT|nr:hypothetical protein [Rufibacter latericius]RNI23620.1 hypothetical protein EFB08_19025 [Rufibacter latericius]
MKINPLLLFAPVILFSCQSPASQENLSSATAETSASPAPQNPVPRENSEYLDWHTLRINGKYPLVTKVKDMEGLLGKPDSVVKVDFEEGCPGSFRNENSKVAHYGGVSFEQFGDSLKFLGVDFSNEKRVFLQSGNLRIDHTTSPAVLKKHFPNAMKNFAKDSTEAVAIPPAKEPVDGHWLLQFEKGKLKFIDDWFPC